MPGRFVMNPFHTCYEIITNSFYPVNQTLMFETPMLLQLCEIENNDRLIMLMA